MKPHLGIRPALAAGLAALLAGSSFSALAEDPPLKLEMRQEIVTISAGDQNILQYRFAGVPYKPYVKVFRTPAGVNVLRDAPSDHLHHHSLMFAVSVDGVNFWEEHKDPGRQAHRTIQKVSDKSTPTAAFVEQIDWVHPKTKKTLLTESRRIETYSPAEFGASLLTWQSRFSPPAGVSSATLTGSNYFGLGMRFLQSMDTGGTFQNADGGIGVEGTHQKRSDWCAYTAKADGRLVTVAMFDHPKNERYPATWYTMEKHFAYLSNTLNLSKQPLTIKQGQPLTLRYGVALWDGSASAKKINDLYRRWIARLGDEAPPAP